MKMSILIIIVSFLFLSCIRNNPKVYFTNKSNVAIDSFKMYMSNDCPPLVFKGIIKDTEREGVLNFCNPKLGDGSYWIDLFSNGKLIKQTGFGYYTNGASLDYSFDVVYDKNEKIVIKEGGFRF